MKILKPLIVLLLVFVAGVAVGTIGTRLATRRTIREALVHPEKVREKVQRDLVRRLELNAEQQKKVDAVMMQTQDKLKDLRQKNQPEFFQIMSNAQAEISATLTPEQRELFQQYRQENRRFLQPR
jgi:Spy/CpxP family protein refolding chaperone